MNSFKEAGTQNMISYIKVKEKPLTGRLRSRQKKKLENV